MSAEYTGISAKKRGVQGDYPLESKGFFYHIALNLKNHRLGDLLCASGLISRTQLEDALTIQKHSHRPLGEILRQNRVVSAKALRQALVKQWCLRGLAALMMLFVQTGSASNARAEQSTITLVSAMSATPKIPSLNMYPALFGKQERKSRDISPFTKWTGMLDRFEDDIRRASHTKDIENWQKGLAKLHDASLDEKIKGVNAYINQTRYISDDKNWGQTDYWATPVEFLARGGDCEDFAIAKYASLKALGVPESRMRIAIVQDQQKNIPHAVLIVYTDKDALILDNQTKHVTASENIHHYKPIFSINQTGWWLHS